MRLSRVILILLCTYAGSLQARDIFVATSGADSNAGTSSSPKRTIQAAVDTAGPGDRVIVRSGTYSEPNTRAGETYRGIHITRSGTSSSPITIMSETPGGAIIDQNYAAAGFVLWRVTDVTISGFSIRECKWGGVYMTHGQDKRRIVVDRNTIAGCDGDSGSNVGGVYMSSCSECTVSNNTISNIRVGGAFYQNGAGIHGYDQELSTIEGNTISNAFNGIYHKKSSGAKGLIIRNNIIRDVDQGIWYSISAGGNPPHIDQEVYENVISARNNCIRATVDETSSQSRGLFVRNNVFVGCGNALVSRGFRNVVVQNNIFFDTDNDIVTQYGSWRNEIEAESNNLFYPSMRIVLQQYGSETNVSNLSAWRSLSGFGNGGLTGDPLFAAPSSGDYTLRSSSPAKSAGSDGRDIGAFPGGAVAAARPTPPPGELARPMPPGEFVIQ